MSGYGARGGLGRLFAVLLLLAASVSPSAPRHSLDLVIMGSTDIHSYVLPVDYYTGKPAPYGFARIAGAIRRIRKTHPYTLLVDSGDLIQGSPLATYAARVESFPIHPMIAAMNALHYTAATVGNHEFDFGAPYLERQARGATFPFLAANVRRKGTARTLFSPYVIREVELVKVGILGLTTPGVMIWDARHLADAGIEVDDAVAAARRFVPEMKAAGASLIVAVIHSGLGPGSSYSDTLGVPEENAGTSLANAAPGLDVIFLGHTHAVVPDTRVNGVLLVQAGEWGGHLAVARLRMARGPAGWVVAGKSAEVLDTSAEPPDPRIETMLRAPHARTVAYLARPLTHTPVPFSSRDARWRQNALIDLINHVAMQVTGAQLAATPAFNTSLEIPPGPIRVADIAALYPYEDTIRSVRLSGAQLREYLEKSAEYFQTFPNSNLINPRISGNHFDILSGASYALDISRPVGRRVVRLEVNGRPVADADSFSLAVNAYRQGGAGGYSLLKSAPVIYAGADSMRQILIDWMARQETLQPGQWRHGNWELEPREAVEQLDSSIRRTPAAWLRPDVPTIPGCRQMLPSVSGGCSL